ncbi:MULTISPECIES: ATP-NAD kinase family protein [Halorussus]|uniref:ATP-NAD kinase family protein n=1 Tax=Halorussus TaxID=1070314 RepID=UPI000E217FD9|nr:MULTISPECIES: ATP-NAD kinase family protein [Halorussus]NHN59038.1 ATP-NAD kinase family protein [Halorussus sp. JP-T4]
MRTIGVVVNPVAGMGGRVGLKGTDGKVEAARERGAEPRAPDRAVDALGALRERVDASGAPDVDLLTYGGEMGEREAREAGFDPVIVGRPEREDETTAADTREAVRRFVAEGVDLILFVGGDGTAVDVAETLDEEGAEVPVLGVPAGVKVYSAVFAVTPEAAGRVAADFDRTEDREVNDIDEDAYREGEVRAELRAVVAVPVAEDLQSSKQVGGGTVESLAAGVADDIRSDEGATYVLGPGSTVGAVKDELGFEGSPLGVDVWRSVSESEANGGSSDESDGGEVLVEDATEDEILAHLDEKNVVVVSPIGGQGFVFGRGNDQISPEVVRRSSVEIIASKPKLDGIGVLRVDTGDDEVDDSLRGWRKVRVGRFERRMMKVV